LWWGGCFDLSNARLQDGLLGLELPHIGERLAELSAYAPKRCMISAELKAQRIEGNGEALELAAGV
jgi:hypothetical protein